MSGGNGVARQRASLQPLALQDAGKHAAGCLVERRAGADAQHRILDLQPGAERFENRKLIDLLLLLDAGERRQSSGSFLDLDLHLPEPAARLEIGEVVHHLVDGFLDAFQIVRIERAAFGITLGELQTAKRHLIEIVDEGRPFFRQTSA